MESQLRIGDVHDLEVESDVRRIDADIREELGRVLRRLACIHAWAATNFQRDGEDLSGVRAQGARAVLRVESEDEHDWPIDELSGRLEDVEEEQVFIFERASWLEWEVGPGRGALRLHSPRCQVCRASRPASRGRIRPG